jgi:8-oxo-dGTP pyrophosphatase MutT (NUDIX family)
MMKIRVGGILIEEGCILLARHRRQGRTYWTLPGGGVEEGETLTEALRREWIEETGITIADRPPLRFLLDVVTPLGHGHSRHIVNLIFEVQQEREYPISEPYLVPGEHLDMTDWVTLEEFSVLPFLPPVQSEILRLAEGWNPQELLYLNNRWIDLNAMKGMN